MTVPLQTIRMAHPAVSDEAVEAVIAVLRSGMLSGGGRVEAFESDFAQYVGAEHAIALANGTAALEVALMAYGVGPGDEVITVPFSFFASTGAILRVGATPVFVDVSPTLYTMDVGQVAAAVTPRTKAILPVDLYGQMAPMEEIIALARRHDLAVIEDGSQAHGASRYERRAGSWTTTTFSFYATKNLALGEGGMITTASAEIARSCRLLRNHGSDRRYEHLVVGTNLRMSELHAAIGSAMLPGLEAANAQRRANAERLSALLADSGLELPETAPGNLHVWHQYTIRVSGSPGSRDALRAQLTDAGIDSAVHYPRPIHQQPALTCHQVPTHHSVSERLAETVLSLPVHPGVSDEDLERIAAVISSWTEHRVGP